jgi:prepilin-type N-terminal cleavage/methylation domain-containing protein
VQNSNPRVNSLRHAQYGFTLVELMVVVFIIGLLSAIAVSKVMGTLDKARLARCQTELRNIQEEVWEAFADNGSPIDPVTYWKTKWKGKKPGPYFYLVDDEAGVGFGFDLDGINEKAPSEEGKSSTKKDVKFVVFCQHDHNGLADYVYLEDDGPPTLANFENQPGYDRFIN